MRMIPQVIMMMITIMINTIMFMIKNDHERPVNTRLPGQLLYVLNYGQSR